MCEKRIEEEEGDGGSDVSSCAKTAVEASVEVKGLIPTELVEVKGSTATELVLMVGTATVE